MVSSLLSLCFLYDGRLAILDSLARVLYTQQNGFNEHSHALKNKKKKWVVLQVGYYIDTESLPQQLMKMYGHHRRDY